MNRDQKMEDLFDEFFVLFTLINLSWIAITFAYYSAYNSVSHVILVSGFVINCIIIYLSRKEIGYKLKQLFAKSSKLKSKNGYRLKKNIKITSLDNLDKLYETVKALKRLKEVYEYTKKYDGVTLQFFKHDEREDRGDVYTQVYIQSYVIDGVAKDAIADGLESYIEELEIALSKYVDM